MKLNLYFELQLFLHNLNLTLFQKLEHKGVYKKGKKHGAFEKYHKNGKLTEKKFYEEDVCYKTEQVD